jgi:D-arabinose 1-dehydrogenase-like Zn-dependent alcohol dehydrogenase
MGSRQDLENLVQMVVEHDIRPPIHEVIALSDARRGFEAMVAGSLFGKVVVRP